MRTKRSLALALLFTSLISFAGMTPAAQAGVRVNLGIRVAVPPPPLRHEVVRVRPGRGYAWIPGYWDWRPVRHDYVWVPGYWARPPRAHSVWVAPRYVTRNHHHYYRHGYWRR